VCISLLQNLPSSLILHRFAKTEPQNQTAKSNCKIKLQNQIMVAAVDRAHSSLPDRHKSTAHAQDCPKAP
jgi:hypothetical protein